MNPTELENILKAHSEWRKDSTKGERANLTGANLTEAYLYDAALYGANLRGANLTGADLTRANLTRANLTGANLTGANLIGANLRVADLYKANLTGAYLYKADLTGANLTDANLTEARLPHFQLCPEEGSFIGWKKLAGGIVAKLLIAEDAKRTSSLVGRKCRASAVHVLGFFSIDGKRLEQSSALSMSGDTLYTLDKVVTPDSYDDDIRVECTHGIHFFMTRREAEEYT